MKLELLDAYNIRARLSTNIILLAPFAITLFSIFEEARSFATSSVVLFVLLAFTNYVPTMQRRLIGRKKAFPNYVAEMLSQKDSTFDEVSKTRYYKILASLDSAFSLFESPDDSEKFRLCCESAVLYLRSHTRENKLVQEENINYGFCKNLLANKPAGIIVCSICSLLAVCYSINKFGSLQDMPSQICFTFLTNMALLFFWVFGITIKTLELSAKQYAKTLIMAIDTLKN